ncbi:glutaredoxin family protein [Stieleria sp.]|uniref:glutaredoxin family protein n=1 Tax=Stieleria sp. TaxID=2795976 RepID=UPI0035650C89
MAFRIALLSCLFWSSASLTWIRADDPPPDQATYQIRLDVFVRSDRESADAVQEYCDQLKQRINGLDIRLHDVLHDKTQLIRLYELSKQAGREKPLLPAFYACDRMYFGFDDARRTGPEIEQLFTANLYTRTTCPKCGKLKAFLPTLQQRWPAIRFVIHDVDRSATARTEWETLCRKAGSPPGLPTIDFARRILIGYQGDESTGAQLEQLIREVSGMERPEPLSRRRPSGASFQLGGGTDRKLEAYATVLPTALLVAQATQQEDNAVEIPMDLLELPEEATPSQSGESETPIEVVTSDTIDVPMLGPVSASKLGMPVFTLAIGLVDGFNPCAMWVLVFLLSVLVNIKDRRKILLIAGTFVFISGLAYFAFMAAWLNIFLLIGIARPVQLALGFLALFIGVINVKDFFAFKKGLSFSIPESSKPGLYRRVREIVSAKYLTVALTGAVVLAVIVNMIELLCTAGLPALYTQVLTIQDYPAWKNYAFLSLYILAYMLDDTLLVAVVVVTLSHRKLQEREGRWLKLLSGAVILVLGLVMILRPSWLQLGS